MCTTIAETTGTRYKEIEVNKSEEESYRSFLTGLLSGDGFL